MRQALRLHPDSRCAAVTRIEVDVTRPRAGSSGAVLCRHRQDRRPAPAAGDGFSARGRALAAHLLRGLRPRFARRGVLRVQLCAFDPVGGLSVRWLPQRDARCEPGSRAPRIEVQSAAGRYTLQARAGVGRAFGAATQCRLAPRPRGGDRGNGREQVVLGIGASAGQAGFPSCRWLCVELFPAYV